MTSLYTSPSNIYGQEKKTSLLEKKKAQWARERQEAGEWNPFGKPGCGAPMRQRRATLTLPTPDYNHQTEAVQTPSTYQTQIATAVLPQIATASPDSGISGVASNALLATTQNGQMLYVPVSGLQPATSAPPILVQAISMPMTTSQRYAPSQHSTSSYTEQWANSLNYWDTTRPPEAGIVTAMPAPPHQRSTSIERRVSPCDARSIGSRCPTLPPPQQDDDTDYINRMKAAEAKQQLESQLAERRFLEQRQQLLDAHDEEQAIYERKLIEMRQEYEKERESNKQQMKKEADEQRQAQVRDAIERAQREAAQQRHAKMMRHASQAKRDDDSGLGSSERLPAQQRPLNNRQEYIQRMKVHDTTTSTDDDYNDDTETDRAQPRKNRRAPSPPIATINRDERPIKPQSRDPLEIWAEIEKTLPAPTTPENESSVIRRQAKSRMSLRTPARRQPSIIPTPPATAAPSNGPTMTNDEKSVKPPIPPKPGPTKLSANEQKTKSRRRSRSKSKEKKKATKSGEKSSTQHRSKPVASRATNEPLMDASSSGNVESRVEDNPWAGSLGSNTNPLLQPLVTRRRKPRVLAPMLDKLSLDVSDTSDTSTKQTPSPFRRAQLTPSKEMRGKVPSASKTPADLLITPAHVVRNRTESGASQTSKDENLPDTPKREFGFRRGGLSQSLRLKSRPVPLENIDKPDVVVTGASKTPSASSQQRNQAALLGQLSALREQLKSRQRQIDSSTSYALRDSPDRQDSLVRLSVSRMSLRAMRRKEDDKALAAFVILTHTPLKWF